MIDITNNSDFMVKLYKKLDGKHYYWETWNEGSTKATVHWGQVGQYGNKKTVKSGLFSNFKKIVQKEINEQLKEGFKELDEKQRNYLELTYPIDGFGTEQDLEKRHNIENYLNDLLGWTGLGSVDGGSIGNGSMEIGCEVVDVELALKVIKEGLKQVGYDDYTDISKME